MSTLRQYCTPTIRTAHSNECPIALRPMRTRHHRTLSYGNTTTQVPVMGINYFIKWVEAEPLATITEKNVRNFVWKALSIALRSLKSLSPIVESNLITKHSKISANSWGSRTTTLHPPTYRPIDSLRLQTNHCSK